MQYTMQICLLRTGFVKSSHVYLSGRLPFVKTKREQSKAGRNQKAFEVPPSFTRMGAPFLTKPRSSIRSFVSPRCSP